MSKPVTIKIFLPEGDPTGIKEAEIINWTGKSFVIPRKKIKTIGKSSVVLNELQSQGVYFLIGEDNLEMDKVYIGEAENLFKRLKRHQQKGEDFWNKIVCFFSKDENLTKAHVKYLESRIIEIVSENNRAELKNSNNSSQPSLSRSDKANVENYLEKIKLLLPTLGYNYLKNLSKEEVGKTYYCKAPTNNVKAKGKLTNEGFVVLKNSLISKKESPSFDQKSSKNLRDELIENKILISNENNYKLKEDQLFSSPSAAAGFVLGRNANGWTEWQTEDGRTLDEIERQED